MKWNLSYKSISNPHKFKPADKENVDFKKVTMRNMKKMKKHHRLNIKWEEGTDHCEEEVK